MDMNKAVHNRIIQALDDDRAFIVKKAAEDVKGCIPGPTVEELNEAYAVFDNQLEEIKQNWA